MLSEKEREEKALGLKEEGNKFFKEKDYQAAISKYSQAIEISPKISILYSNRSRCHRLLQEFDQSYDDAEMAVQLDDKNIKAYFLKGQALVDLAVHSKSKDKIELAIEQLKKSLSLCPSQGKTEFEERFVDEIYKAKKKLWNLSVGEEKQKKKALKSYLINTIETDKDLEEEEKDSLSADVESLLEKNFKVEPVPIPKALVCPITNMIMKDPVCNEHGNSYSKRAYSHEIFNNGKIDPITKKPIKTTILYPNINLKKAIEAFLAKNPWAYDHPAI